MRAQIELRNQSAVPPQFEERRRCICCGGSELKPVWEGVFSSEQVRGYLGRYHYNVDLSVLADERFSLAACGACGMTFQSRVLTPEWLKILYTNWIDDSQITRFEADYNAVPKPVSDFEQARGSARHLSRLKELSGNTRGTAFRVLDYGCGDGAFLEMAHLFGFEAYGIDFSDTRSLRASERGVRFFGSLRAFDDHDAGPLDAVTAFQVLEHLADPVQTLQSLRQRMAPGAVLIAEVPDCTGRMPPESFEDFRCVQPLEHINAFTPQSLSELCRRAGFTPLAKPAAYVTAQPMEVLRTALRRVKRRASTQQYFRKT